MDPTERRNADQADEEAMKNMVWGKGLVQQEEQLALKKRIAEVSVRDRQTDRQTLLSLSLSLSLARARSPPHPPTLPPSLSFCLCLAPALTPSLIAAR